MIDKARDAGDDEGLILTEEERRLLLGECPALRTYIRGAPRRRGVPERERALVPLAPRRPHGPSCARAPACDARIDRVRKFRLGSGRPQTRKLAATPTLFGEIRQPTSPYLLIPTGVVGEPALPPHWLPRPGGDRVRECAHRAGRNAVPLRRPLIGHAQRLRCEASAAWMKSDYQYSSQISYNNFVWPCGSDRQAQAGGRSDRCRGARGPQRVPRELPRRSL